MSHSGLEEMIVKLKEGGFNLEKTYLLDAYVKVRKEECIL